MAAKIKYLDELGQPLDFALVVLDPIIMGSDESPGPAFVNPPQLQHTLAGRLSYHYTYFRAATIADFLKSWILFAGGETTPHYGRNMIFEPSL